MNNILGQPVSQEKSEPGTSKIWSGYADFYTAASFEKCKYTEKNKINLLKPTSNFTYHKV